jgi:hypothetical protein
MRLLLLLAVVVLGAAMASSTLLPPMPNAAFFWTRSSLYVPGIFGLLLFYDYYFIFWNFLKFVPRNVCQKKKKEQKEKMTKQTLIDRIRERTDTVFRNDFLESQELVVPVRAALAGGVEAVVVLLLPELRADLVAQLGGAYAPDGATPAAASGSLRALRRVLADAPVSVVDAAVYRGDASLTAALDAVATEVGAERVARLGRVVRSALLRDRLHEMSLALRDGTPDLVIVELPPLVDEASADVLDACVRVVDSFFSEATGGRYAALVAGDAALPATEHATKAREALRGSFATVDYWGRDFWHGAVVMFILLLILAVGLHCNFAIQTPTRFENPKSGKKGALAAEHQ